MKTLKKITDPHQQAYVAARRCGKHYTALNEVQQEWLLLIKYPTFPIGKIKKQTYNHKKHITTMPDSYELAKQEKERMMDHAMLVAYASCAMLGLKEDDISENEAFSLYDRGWIKDRTQRGLLHYSRKGATIRSAKVYSRFEIESLKRAEKNVTEQFLKAKEAIDKLQTKIEKK